MGKEITRVIGIYDRLSQYEGEPGVVIAYGSMYGHTEQMAEEIARELAANGIKRLYSTMFPTKTHRISSKTYSATGGSL